MKQLTKSLLISLSILLPSCQEEKIETAFLNGTVLFLGEPASDGCGWVVEISNVNYSPTKLSDDYKINNLEIEISYTLLTSIAPCGFSEPINEILINDIRRAK